MTHPYKGLTWDHPRGYAALTASGGALVRWDRHPLEGFESRSVAEQCALYDLVVLDHPHVGEAVAAECLVPMEELFTAGELDSWHAATIGPSFSSYRYAGAHWALPLDAATQVMACRARPGRDTGQLGCGDRLGRAPAGGAVADGVAYRRHHPAGAET